MKIKSHNALQKILKGVKLANTVYREFFALGIFGENNALEVC